jgi:hypothetical protein
MGVARFLHIIQALVVLQVCSRTQAYSFASSCGNFGDDNLELRNWLKESMAEAKDLATWARDRVTKPDADQFDNSHEEIWHGETDVSKLSVAEGTHVIAHGSLHMITLTPIGYYQKVIDMPHWEYTESVGSLVLDGLTLECGGDSIVPDGNKWFDMTTLYYFDLGPENAPKGPNSHICDGTEGWPVSGKYNIQNPTGAAGEESASLIIMCKQVIERLRDPDIAVRSEHPQLEAASFAMVKRQGMLKERERISKSLSHVWSSILLHEMFHLVLNEESNYLPFFPLAWVN